MKGGTPRGARQVRITRGNLPSLGAPPKTQSGIPWVQSKKNGKKSK